MRTFAPSVPLSFCFGARVGFSAHGVEQAFRPAVRRREKPALAAEVPDPAWLEMKDVPNCMDTPPPSVPGVA